MMAEHGFEVFGSNGSSWLGSRDLTARLVTSIPVRAGDDQKWASIAQTTADNTSVITAPGVMKFSNTAQRPFYPSMAEVSNGGVRFSALEGLASDSRTSTITPARILVFRIK